MKKQLRIGHPVARLVVIPGSRTGSLSVLEARLEDHEVGHLEYARRDELVGPHIYLADIAVEAPFRHTGVARALVSELVRRAGTLPIYIAPRTHNSMAGNDFFESWNRHAGFKVRWHAS